MKNTTKGRGKPSTVVYCVVHEGRVTLVSSSSRDVSGIAPETFAGSPVADVIHPDDHARLAHFLAPGWSGSFSETVRVRDADGAWSWRMMRGVRTIDEEGRASAVVRLKKIAEPRSVTSRTG